MSDKIAIHNDKKPINVFISYKRDDNLYNHLVRIVKKTFPCLIQTKSTFPKRTFMPKNFWTSTPSITAKSGWTKSKAPSRIQTCS